MKNILIRSGISPLETIEAPDMIARNSIGSNVGNLIYAYSVYRTLITEDTTITPDYYRINHNDADEINEKYDCYIIPLADAFRADFMPLLRRYTALIKKLTIPVIVIGVGLRAPFEPKLNEGFPFDKDVKEFVKAVLERSNMIGVRGEFTADYLTKLGFQEEVDHTVIGCPSMYTFGRNLHIRETEINKDSMVCVNSSKVSPNNVLDFISRGMDEFPNHYFIPQWLIEMKLTYTGAPNLGNPTDNYPSKMSDPVYMNNRVRYFLNAPTWIDFIGKADLSFGARLHGNITATIAGTPSIIIPKDARMRELTLYHNLTHIWYNDLTDDMSLQDVIEISDFQAPVKVQKKNFDHFIDFLNKNNLEHIYEDDINRADAPLDQMIQAIEQLPPIVPISGCSIDEIVTRFEKYVPLDEQKRRSVIKGQINKEVNSATKKLNKQIQTKDKRIKWLEGTLNRKSARVALKVANTFRFK